MKKLLSILMTMSLLSSSFVFNAAYASVAIPDITAPVSIVYNDGTDVTGFKGTVSATGVNANQQENKNISRAYTDENVASSVADPTDSSNKVIKLSLPQKIKDFKTENPNIVNVVNATLQYDFGPIEGTEGDKIVVKYSIYYDPDGQANQTEFRANPIAHGQRKTIGSGSADVWNGLGKANRTVMLEGYFGDTPQSTKTAIAADGKGSWNGNYYIFPTGWNTMEYVLDYETKKVHYYINGYDFGGADFNHTASTGFQYLVLGYNGGLTTYEGSTEDSRYELLLDDISVTAYPEFEAYSEETEVDDTYVVKFTSPVTHEIANTITLNGEVIPADTVTVAADGMSITVSGLEPNTQYTLIVPTTATSKLNQTIKSEFTKTFTTNYDDLSVESNVVDMQTNVNPANIELYFNKSVDVNALKNALVVTGEKSSVKVSLDSTGKIATVSIIDFVSLGQYTLKISSGLISVNEKNKLAEDYTLTFTAKEIRYVDKTAIIDNLTDETDITDMKLIFPEAVDASEILKFITISDLEGKLVDCTLSLIESQDNTVVNFTVPTLESNKTYTLKVEKTASVLSGAFLNEDYIKKFTTAQFKTISLIDVYAGVMPDNTVNVTLNFTDEVNKNDIIQKTKIFKDDTEIKNVSITADTSTGDDNSCKIVLNISGLEADELYTCVLDESWKDSNGNILAKGCKLAFATESGSTLKVISSNIKDGENGVSVEPIIKIAFNNAVTDTDILNNLSFEDMSGNDLSSKISEVTVNDSEATIIFNKLGSGIVYKLTLSENIGLKKDYVLSFKTESVPYTDEEISRDAIDPTKWSVTEDATYKCERIEDYLEFSRKKTSGDTKASLVFSETEESCRNKIVTYEYKIYLPKAEFTEDNKGAMLSQLKFAKTDGGTVGFSIRMADVGPTENTMHVGINYFSSWKEVDVPYDKWITLRAVCDYKFGKYTLSILNDTGEVLSSFSPTNDQVLYSTELTVTLSKGSMTDKEHSTLYRIKDVSVSSIPVFVIENGSLIQKYDEDIVLLASKKISQSDLKNMNPEMFTLNKIDVDGTKTSVLIDSVSIGSDSRTVSIKPVGFLEIGAEYELSMLKPVSSVQNESATVTNMKFTVEGSSKKANIEATYAVFKDAGGDEVNISAATSAEFNLTISNSSSEEKEIFMSVAAYKNGKMIAANTVRSFLCDSFNLTKTNVSIDGISGADCIKIFMFDAINGNPVQINQPIEYK